MLDLSNPVINQVWQHLQSSKNILLHCHYSPDPDSVGSALAMMHCLRNLGKNAVVIQGDTEFPSQLKILPGSESVLAMSYSQVDLADFDTFIVLDSSNVEQISRKGEVVFPPELTVIVIDHHSNNVVPAVLKIVDEDSIATAEILFNLFTHWNIHLTSEIAQCLLLAIYDDSGGFKYAKTSSATFSAAAKLTAIYPDFPKLIFQLENDLTPQSLTYLSLALNSLQHFFSNRLAVTLVENTALTNHHISQTDTKLVSLSNLLKSVKGWDIGVAIYENTPGIFDFSFRSRIPDELDVSAISRSLGGGGHKVAAGATVKGTKEEVLKLLLQTIQNLYPQLGTA